MQRRADKIATIPARSFAFLSWALIIGGTAMMLFAGIPLIIIATLQLSLPIMWPRKPD